MKKNGFTLVEILAIIVLLGIISGISATAIIRTRKNANKELVKQLEINLTQAGEEVYVYEKLMGSGGTFNTNYRRLSNGGTLVISLKDLRKGDYIKNVKNGEFISPVNSNERCQGYLEVKKTSSGPTFKGYVNCDGLYTTTGYDGNTFTSVRDTEILTNSSTSH